MRSIILMLSLAFSAGNLRSQPWLELLPKNKSRAELTFKDYREAFYTYWAPYNVIDGYYEKDGEQVKAAGYKQFKRWEWLQEQRVHRVTGEFPKKSAFEIVEAHNRVQGTRRPPVTANWKSLGPSSTDKSADGLGRINTIGFHPTDPNTYWAGTPSGGFWVTHDDGGSWTCLTDHLESLGATDVIVDINFEENKTLYIATGDRDSYDNISIGVMKSTDAGQSWQKTGLSFQLQELKVVNRILQDYTNPQVLYAATNEGVFKSSNAGETWNELLITTEFIDMEMHPVNPQILYGSTDEGFVYVSTNGGINWKANLLEPGGRRTELAVTPAAPSRLYAITSSGGLEGVWRSDDNGSSFYETLDGESLNILGWNYTGLGDGGQAWYDLAIAASPNDPDMLVAGGINTWLSKDGGYTWKYISGLDFSGIGEQVHVDKHFLFFRGDEIWEGNDGGIYVSRDTGYIWSDKTNGMAISQMYRLGISQTEPFEMLTGLQDNGTKHLSGHTWDHAIGGDGMEAMINHQNADIQYGSSQYGNIFRTYDRWKTSRFVKPPSAGEGNWVTPYAMDPVNADIIYAGYRELWKSTDQCSTWIQVSDVNSAGRLRSIAIAPSDPNVIYIADNFNIWKTTTGEGPFEEINVVDITNTNQVTCMSVKHDDPGTVWVSIGGFWDPGVYVIHDGGSLYENISEGLPQIPVFCVIQNKQYDGVQLFAGTELGVYVKTDDEPWVAFNEGLPNVIVSELEIYYHEDPHKSKLRAATYGRGAWETRLAYDNNPMSVVAANSHQASTERVKPNRKQSVILKINIEVQGDQEPQYMYTMTFDTEGCTDAAGDLTGASLFYTGEVGAFSNSQQLGFVSDPDGTFTFSIDQPLHYGDNYFWLTYDVSLDATLQNVVDARFLSFSTGQEFIPSTSDPDGNRIIDLFYCDAGSTVVMSEHIRHVSAGNQINQLSQRGMNGYQDFTEQVIEMQMDDVIDVAVTNSQAHPNNELLMWVDWNQDGEFDAPGELCYASGPSGVNTYQFAFTPPDDARPGLTRMRIRLHDINIGFNATPCGTSSLGEVEDYSVLLHEEATGQETVAEGQMRIIPNPASGWIRIETDKEEEISLLEILDPLGRVAYREKMGMNRNVDIGNLPEGVYYVKVCVDERVLLEKVVVK